MGADHCARCGRPVVEVAGRPVHLEPSRIGLEPRPTFVSCRPGPLAAVPPVSPPAGGAVPSVARSEAAAPITTCPPASAVAGPQLPARATHTST